MNKALVDHALSALLALGLTLAFLTVGLGPHRQHASTADHDGRALLAAVRAIPGGRVEEHTAEHHVFGYANKTEACAAEASVVVHTGVSLTALYAQLASRRLPTLSLQQVGADTVRASVFQAFGSNPLDWSCWQ